MSWRDKVQAMREGINSQKCPEPSLPKPPKSGSVSFDSTPPAPFPEKTGFSVHPASPIPDTLENLRKPQFAAVNNPAPEPAAEAWRELAQAYYRHHFKCVVCIAAGRGAGYGLRCGAGAALWASYLDSP